MSPCLHIEREREWERARLAIDLLAERKHFVTLTPDEFRLLGGAPAEMRVSQPLDSQLRYAMMQLDLAAIRLHAIATDIAAKNAGEPPSSGGITEPTFDTSDEPDPFDDEPTQP